MADLEERLRSHSDAFSGLMSLIPAKYYYEEDHSDQWQRKKQTKEEAKNAKLAKLDPDAAKSAKDVMDENAQRKRKREDNENENEDDNRSLSSGGELGSELPKEGLKRGGAKTRKQTQEDAADEHNNKRNVDAEERRKQKAEKKAEKKTAQRERKKAKDAAKVERRKGAEEQPKPTTTEQSSADTQKDSSGKNTEKDTPVEGNDGVDVVDGFAPETGDRALEETSSTSSTPELSNFEMSNDNSGSSSISSIVPPSETAPKPGLKSLKTTPDELRQRLQKRLDELRAARRADGLNGKPAKTRQELIEARRIKADERKRHKKELRRKAKEEEEQKKDDEMQRRFSPGGSGSLLASPRSPAESLSSNSNNFAFGRIAFPDGQHADPTLSRLLDDKARQGPRDPAAALKAAEAKKTRFSELDSEKRAELEEKDMWLNAKKRAHGERVRDDTSLLKKALKRKESAKKKSEREWRERLDTVSKGKEMKQQRRDENIRKRKEGSGGGGGAGKKATGKGSKPKARPGFEGSFKAKSGGGGGGNGGKKK